MKGLNGILFLGLIILLPGFDRIRVGQSPYDFKKPVATLVLPPVLHEISGLTILDSVTFACIQDENGILFLYDLKNNKIKQQFVFGPNGDYEAITRVNQNLFVLRSDGVIFEIENYTAKKQKIIQHRTGIPAVNSEGLCYDKEHNRLLIGTKGKINKDPKFRDSRFIYAFDLNTKTLHKNALYTFNVNVLNSFAKAHGVIFPKRKTKNGKEMVMPLKVNTSEIAIHPLTKLIYILSAIDHCLFTVNETGGLESIEQLDHVMFNKAEGLSFFENGDLLITNEGQNGHPTLLRFNYH